MLPHAPRTSFLIRDWEGCTTATNELPNPNQRRVVKTSGFLHPYIYRYTARVPRDRFLALEGEGITWMRQPSRQGIALFSVRMEFWRSTAIVAATRALPKALPSCANFSSNRTASLERDLESRSMFSKSPPLPDTYKRRNSALSAR